MAHIFWEDTYHGHRCVRSRIDQARWNVAKNKREAITHAVVLDLMSQKRIKDAQEVIIRRITALEIADTKGDRKKAWQLARKFESALTADRVRVDPTLMRNALSLVKLENKAGQSDSDSDRA